jgi:hypothetical protein
METETEMEMECPICYDQMECPICYEQNDIIHLISCEKCHHKICLKCYECLKEEVCPFCRSSLSINNNNDLNTNIHNNNTIYSSSYPSYNNNFTTLNDWNQSRILRRQIRRQRKRQEYELQQQRNAELSRIHNKKSKKEKRSNLMFHIDDIFI